MATENTKYLTYIEETRKHHKLIDEVAKESSEQAILISRERKVPVTYLEGEEIIRVKPSGEKETIGRIENNRRKVTVGAKTTLSKK